MQEIPYTVHTFKEGPTFVAYVPELDVSSCGATNEEARRNIREAVQAFVETSAEMGTLDVILQESGYTRSGDSWEAPEFVALDRQRVSVG
ncbi:MAG TPA: type II toxin-antitoxin system HicB family antitoxin [Acidobacteriaceae bacterium]|nr:type II toxin-antitoxin system HicB family antitoxin [Acidobacteriaceae bacterium]